MSFTLGQKTTLSMIECEHCLKKGKSRMEKREIEDMYKLLQPSLTPSECRLNGFRASEEHLQPQIQQRMARLALAP